MLEQNGTELSEREKEILKLVATGASNKEIAQQLVISPNTVKVHLRNIFAKIGVASRTEATLYAIRSGLVQVAVPGDGQIVEEDIAPEAREAAAMTDTSTGPTAVRQPKRRWQWFGGAVLALTLVGALAWTWPVWLPSFLPSPTQIAVTAPPRWQVRADMPTARAGLATAVVDNFVYAIAGEDWAGPSGVLERYNSNTNTWQTLTSKPTPVADVQAAVIGGKILVPGGRLTSGRPTSLLEVYDPVADQWSAGADMPIGLSQYALAAFEGRLYVFGGWDGAALTATVFAYDPAMDRWVERTPMPSARGLAGATTTGNGIYVIGGTNGDTALTLNLEYQPSRDVKVPSPQAWLKRASLPEARQGLGVANVADLIIAIGGGPKPTSALFQYVPNQDLWTAVEVSEVGDLTGLSLAVVETRVYALGGRVNDGFSSDNWAYQAFFTLTIPFFQQP